MARKLTGGNAGRALQRRDGSRDCKRALVWTSPSVRDHSAIPNGSAESICDPHVDAAVDGLKDVILLRTHSGKPAKESESTSTRCGSSGVEAADAMEGTCCELLATSLMRRLREPPSAPLSFTLSRLALQRACGILAATKSFSLANSSHTAVSVTIVGGDVGPSVDSDMFEHPGFVRADSPGNVRADLSSDAEVNDRSGVSSSRGTDVAQLSATLGL